MRYIILGLGILAALAAAPVTGQEANGDPLACAAIPAAADRLACYDGIFRPNADLAADDTIQIESKQLIQARPTGRGRATMLVACRGGELTVRFSFAGQLLSETGDNAPISFQVQQTGNVVRNLPVTPDNRTIFFPSAAASDAFLETLEGGDSLIVRITPPRQRSIQSEFDLRPHVEAIAAMRESCRQAR